MLNSIAMYFMAAVGCSAVAVSPRAVLAQVPDPASTPRLAVPSRGVVAQPAPTAQPPGQPTASPAAAAPAEPAPVTAVTGPPAGVTTVGASPATASSSQAAMISRSYVAGSYGLTLGGVAIGWAKTAEGGGATADVVVERLGPDGFAAKHLAGIKYEPLVLVTDFQSKELHDWIAASWKGSVQRKNGSLQSMDHNYKVVSELEFMNALVAETTIPAFDPATKEATFITVKLLPEYTRAGSGSGSKTSATPDLKNQKRWSQANFRFEMAGLDGSKITRIDSFTVRQTVAESPVGEQRDYQKEPGAIQFPNLRITLNEVSSQTWADWHNDFVVKGNSGQEKERSGAIVYLDPTLKTEVGRINLSGCGIYRLAPEKVKAGSETIRRVVAELYCERMELAINAAK